MEKEPAFENNTSQVLEKHNPPTKKKLSAALIVIVLVYSGLMLVLLTGSRSVPEVFPAPDFSMQDIMGPEKVFLADYQGRPLILYFFASW